MKQRLIHWGCAVLFVSGLILCSQDPFELPWSIFVGIACFTGMGVLATFSGE